MDCFSKFTSDDKTEILRHFNSMDSKAAQDTYLASSIKAMEIQRRRPSKKQTSRGARGLPPKQRCSSYKYRITVGTVHRIVCQKAFASLHGIGLFRVKRLCMNARLHVAPSEQRGKHRNRANKIHSVNVRLIDSHIRSFPYKISHYGRGRSQKRYLQSDLSVMKMYKLFLEKYDDESYQEFKVGKNLLKLTNAPVKYWFYFRYFKDNFNYGFGRPRTDVCSVCSALDVKIKAERNQIEKKKLEVALKLHRYKAKAFYRRKGVCAEAAKNNPNIAVISFDFQQNIPCPHLSVSDVFYSRQLWLYNLGFHNLGQNKATMYMWPENVARRGVNEVISCLNHYIENSIADNVRELTLFTDSCPGQNKNHTMVQYCYTMVKIKERFDKITHIFPVRGHSYLPNDTDFSRIEKIKRTHETVYTPAAWIELVKELYDVVSVSTDMILDYKGHLSHFFKRNVTRNKHKFLISTYKVFEYCKTHKHEIRVSIDMNSVTYDDFNIEKANVSVSMPTEAIYDGEIPINELKLGDVKKLVKFVPEEHRACYESLTASVNVDDNEGETDLDE